jgi:hypothetical protein
MDTRGSARELRSDQILVRVDRWADFPCSKECEYTPTPTRRSDERLSTGDFNINTSLRIRSKFMSQGFLERRYVIFGFHIIETYGERQAELLRYSSPG